MDYLLFLVLVEVLTLLLLDEDLLVGFEQAVGEGFVREGGEAFGGG